MSEDHHDRVQSNVPAPCLSCLRESCSNEGATVSTDTEASPKNTYQGESFQSRYNIPLDKRIPIGMFTDDGAEEPARGRPPRSNIEEELRRAFDIAPGGGNARLVSSPARRTSRSPPPETRRRSSDVSMSFNSSSQPISSKARMRGHGARGPLYRTVEDPI